MKWNEGADWLHFQLMLFITLVVGSFCQGGTLQKAKEFLSTSGTQLNANARHLEQGCPKVITWTSLMLTGFDKHMYMLCYAFRSTCSITSVCPRDLSNPRQDSA